MSRGIPRFLCDEDSLERWGKFSIFFEGEGELKFSRGKAFCSGRFEFIQKVALRKKAERTHLSLGLDGELQGRALCLGKNGNVRKGNGEIFTDVIEKPLKIDVRFWLRRKGEIEVGLAGQAGFLASEPLDICFDRKGGGYFFVIRDRESCKEECFLFVSVAYERGEEDFFWKWKLKRASRPS